MNYLQKITALVLMLGIIGFTGCKQNKTTTGSDNDTKIEKSEIQSDVEEIVYPLPAPFELSKKLDDIGASYLSNILNPADRADKYFTEKNKAIALGVYGADLAYTITYDKSQDSKVYAKAVKTLANSLGIDISYLDMLDSETKEKFENKDSVVSVITNLTYNTYEFFKQKSDPALAALMLSGTWVEGLYIASHISEDTFNNREIVQIIYDQSKSLGIVIEALDKFEGDAVVDGINGALKKLKSLYDKTDGALSEEQLNIIIATIETIRASLVE